MSGTIIHQILSTATGLRELFFPRRCVVCGRVLEAEERDLCGDCLEELPLTYQWLIPQNAAFERLARRFDVEAAASLFFFGSESDYRHILYGIKYGSRTALARRLGRMLGSYLAQIRDFRKCEAVVPVPLHRLKKWKRGYNQAEEIARGIAASLGIPVESRLLARSRYTRTQTRMSVDDKAKNVQGAFRLDDKRCEELKAQGVTHVLLVDDVLTTGSTLASSAAPLQAAGFRVSTATLAFVG